MLELEKADTQLDQEGIRTTVVVFGGARLKEGDRWYARRASSAGSFRLPAGERDGRLRDRHGGRTGRHGGGEPWRLRRRCEEPRLQHRPSARAGPEPLHHAPLCFHFHYFALRKMHFLLRAKALVAFPGGFGTLDELFETLTLIQTRKSLPVPVVLFGREFWEKPIDLDFLVKEGRIAPEDSASSPTPRRGGGLEGDRASTGGGAPPGLRSRRRAGLPVGYPPDDRVADSHGHLTMVFPGRMMLAPTRADAAEVKALVSRARDAGVTRILVPGTLADLRAPSRSPSGSTASSPRSGPPARDEGLRRRPRIPALERLAASAKVVAIGEIGLDYFYDHSPKEDQKRALVAQLKLAERLGRPVLLHNRESEEDLLAILEAAGPESPSASAASSIPSAPRR